ncbi:hypothetical protein BBJ29_005729 [Phytophthora kernoviae]|uniref:Uncharacterized protein n=1 Tax=Phytophthora kernoviae TaxID=325452 RepID=A0A3R7KLG7_9STRA|nr:hypothetical protein BBJ29_005729 [Phytophthora kernoviae]
MKSTDGSDAFGGRRVSAAAAAKSDAGNDFLKVISVDLSSLEQRFESISTRLAAIETRLDIKEKRTTQHESNGIAPEGDEDAITTAILKIPAGDTRTSARKEVSDPAVEKDEGHIEGDVTSTNDGSPDSGDNNATTEQSTPHHKVYTDGVTLAQELESLRAGQLRLKIDHEVARSELAVDMANLRNDLEERQMTELQDFREEVLATSITATKRLQNEYQKLASTMDMSLSEQKLAENRWKVAFEETMAARIQDIWSGLHSTARKLQESMQYLQTEMVTQEESSREVNTFVDTMRASSERLSRDSELHSKKLAEQEKGLEHINEMCNQASVRLDEQDAKLKSEVGMIYRQLETADARVQQYGNQYDAFVTATDKSFATLTSDLAACNSCLTDHQTVLHSLDTAILGHREDIIRMDDRITTTDTKIGSMDGRVSLTEKKLVTTVGMVQEHYQEQQQIVAGLQASINQAVVERAAMKHASSDLSFSVQETQQHLHEVSKVASTTELALVRTAAELPKLHALVTTNSSNIAKNRQSIRDIATMIEDDRKAASTLQTAFKNEVADSVARFTAAEERDVQAQDAIANAAVTAEDVKTDLKAAIVKNGNLIHQLNTMVDSLAITESTEDMEDKMSSFAVACAQLGLKLEFFSRKTGSTDSACVMKDDVKASLAILLTKVIRFLGSGVSIDQNKYLLMAKRSQAVDPVSGQIILEMPPQHVLEDFRVTKAAAFAAKTRLAIDQLQPVLRTNRTSVDFRDAFERKLRFVLEFGLANLFPNMGKPKNPVIRRTGEFGTCIACDRPLDDDPPPEDSDMPPMRHRAQQDNASSLQNEESMVSEQQRSTSNGQHDATSSRPNSAGMRTRIDTKTVVRGRSGASMLRPKGGGDTVHNAPGTGEYVYRGGFRIPKPNPNAMMSASVASLLTFPVASVVSVLPEKAEESTGSPFDMDNSSLERVALLGKCQVVEIPSINGTSGVGGGAAAVRAARPQTAPLRVKSLPRLDVPAPSIDISPVSPPDTMSPTTLEQQFCS